MFKYTRHALEKMDGLGIERDDVKRAVMTGMKWKEAGTEKWHARRAGIEVVFVKEGSTTVIITAYLAGSEQ